MAIYIVFNFSSKVIDDFVSVSKMRKFLPVPDRIVN